jgi:hypothetical protein
MRLEPEKEKMIGTDWTRSETIALAKNSCTQCHGLGLRLGLREKSNPCNCVLRAVFRACYARFRSCVEKEKPMSRVSLEYLPGRGGRVTWGRKDEEYVADFCLVSRRALDDFEYRIFKYHFLLGADWKLCSRRLDIDRGNFFHAVYRIEQKLGRTYRELKPYALFPLDEYFHGPRGVSPRPPRTPVARAGSQREGGTLAPPLLRTA